MGALRRIGLGLAFAAAFSFLSHAAWFHHAQPAEGPIHCCLCQIARVPAPAVAAIADPISFHWQELALFHEALTGRPLFRSDSPRGPPFA